MNKLELYLQSYSNSAALEILLDPTRINAIGNIFLPSLNIPIEMRLYQLQTNNQKTDFTLIEINGYLALENHNRIAMIPNNILMQKAFDRSIGHPHNLFVLLDSKKIEQIEQFRSGGDISLELQLDGFVEISDHSKNIFEKISSREIGLTFKIPQSIWVNNILNKWKFCDTHLLEIRKSGIDNNKIPEETFNNLSIAESHFMNWNVRETFASLYAAFEAFAKNINMNNPDQNFFNNILSDLPSEKRKKYKDLFRYYCDLLHLGRHETNITNDNQTNTQKTELDYKDAQLALIIGQTILSYISKLN